MLKLFAAFCVFVFLTSCNKEKREAINYPTNSDYGVNVLALANNTKLDNTITYSLAAELGKKAKLKLIIRNLSTNTNNLSPGAVWFYGDNTGWKIDDYINNSQTFTSNDNGLIDLNILFENSPGVCTIDFYENSENITQSKKFYW